VHPKLREALAAWLADRPGRPGADTAALFTSGRGTRMTTDALADVIDRITATLTLNDRQHHIRPAQGSAKGGPAAGLTRK
jgi:site-specific recombinase XerC